MIDMIDVMYTKDVMNVDTRSTQDLNIPYIKGYVLGYSKMTALEPRYMQSLCNFNLITK